MLPDKAIEEMVSRVDNRLVVTTDATGSYVYRLKAFEQIVEVTSALGVGTIYLPDVAEAKGKTYAIQATTGNSNTVTVDEKSSGNSKDFTGASLNAAYDRALFYSDGKRWWTIADMFT